MLLKANEQAPDFSLPSTSGKAFTLSKDAKNLPCILFFYPKNFTGGCTKEACEFGNEFDFFQNMDIMILGISRDNIESHHKFKGRYNLPYHLLSDENGVVAEKYGTNIPLLNITKRTTYLLDASHKIAAVYSNFFAAKSHIHEMIKKVNNTKLT